MRGGFGVLLALIVERSIAIGSAFLFDCDGGLAGLAGHARRERAIEVRFIFLEPFHALDVQLRLHLDGPQVFGNGALYLVP